MECPRQDIEGAGGTARKPVHDVNGGALVIGKTGLLRTVIRSECGHSSAIPKSGPGWFFHMTCRRDRDFTTRPHHRHDRPRVG